MEDLKNLDLFTLLDLLARHTNEYTKMLKEGAIAQEYAQCKKMIQNLTAEIGNRRQNDIIANRVMDIKSSDAK